MAGDLVHDLDLEEESPELIATPPGAMTAPQLDRLRAYLAYYYAVSKYVRPRPPAHAGPSLLTIHPQLPDGVEEDGPAGLPLDALDGHLLRCPRAVCRG